MEKSREGTAEQRIEVNVVINKLQLTGGAYQGKFNLDDDLARPFKKKNWPIKNFSTNAVLREK